MKIAIMQPYLFPYLGYFNLVTHSDLFVLYNDVNFIERGWINRNRIISKDGYFTFTIPLIKASSSKLISEITISDNEKWKSKFLKSIELTYKKAPFFKDTSELIFNIIQSPENKLDVFIKNSITKILNYIELEKELIFSSELVYNRINDKSEKLVEIAKILKGNSIIFPEGSKKLYSNIFFEEKKIKTEVIIPNLSNYKQFRKDEFEPGLSIIDVLMFNDKASVLKLFNDYKISKLDASI